MKKFVLGLMLVISMSANSATLFDYDKEFAENGWEIDYNVRKIPYVIRAWVAKRDRVVCDQAIENLSKAHYDTYHINAVVVENTESSHIVMLPNTWYGNGVLYCDNGLMRVNFVIADFGKVN